MALRDEDYRDLQKRIEEMQKAQHATERALTSHLAVCDQRQGRIIADLLEIKKFLWKVGWGVFGGLATAVGGLVMLLLDMKGFFDS